MDSQSLIALLVVGGCVAYLVRVAVRFYRGRGGTHCGCGKCAAKEMAAEDRKAPGI